MREEAEKIYTALKEKAKPDEDVYPAVLQHLEESAKTLAEKLYKTGGR